MENIHSDPVVLKVHNGTLRSDANLCVTCRNALHVQAAQSSNEMLLCGASGVPYMRLREPVGRCTGYLDRSKPTLWDLQQIAWQLMTDKGGRSIGFHSPEQLKQREAAAAPVSVPGFGQ